MTHGSRSRRSPSPTTEGKVMPGDLVVILDDVECEERIALVVGLGEDVRKGSGRSVTVLVDGVVDYYWPEWLQAV